MIFKYLWESSANLQRVETEQSFQQHLKDTVVESPITPPHIKGWTLGFLVEGNYLKKVYYLRSQLFLMSITGASESDFTQLTTFEQLKTVPMNASRQHLKLVQTMPYLFKLSRDGIIVDQDKLELIFFFQIDDIIKIFSNSNVQVPQIIEFDV